MVDEVTEDYDLILHDNTVFELEEDESVFEPACESLNALQASNNPWELNQGGCF